MHKIDNFDETRKAQLINAALDEFSAYGQKKSTIDNILKNSNISKGLFYYYFRDKIDLYEYLLEFCLTITKTKLMDSSVLNIESFIDRILETFYIKAKLYKEYNSIELFLLKAHAENVKLFKKFSTEGDVIYRQQVVSFNIDFSMFVNDDKEANITVVIRYLNSVFHEILNKIPQMEYQEIEDYLKNQSKYLRKIMYKEEYNDKN